MKRLLLVLAGILIVSACSTTTELDKENATLEERLALFEAHLRAGNVIENIPPGMRIDSISINENIISISLNKRFTSLPIRNELIEKLQRAAEQDINLPEENYQFSFYSQEKKLEEFIPNIYRTGKDDFDNERLSLKTERGEPVVTRLDREVYENGLSGKNIVFWHSHGWYYSSYSQRWEWQRPRLFQTVEDLIPMSFTIPFIYPMLENSGANLFIPRERDLQSNEVVIDNDTPIENLSGKYVEFATDETNSWVTDTSGFAYGTPPYPDFYNPFDYGSSRKIRAADKADARVMWLPEIPETGDYAVYVSWQMSDDNVNDAHYTVYHEGGKTDFLVNQQKGGGTWIYLGTFRFKKGFNENRGVVLSNESKTPGKFITADGVRFGGGMGLVERGGAVSGRPKFIEGARYWLQYAGMPDTLVYNFHGGYNDYNDDYKSRGEYVNFLMGAPFGPNKNRNAQGLNIPVDASIAFHTDAGITYNDTTVGTLLIFSSTDLDSVETFPDGVSRMANRDFADIMQSQIVDDIKATFDPAWSRRQLMDELYSESFRPNTPAVLLELLSHQNFTDMKFMLDPRFRFTVSRSIYKSIAKFIAVQNGFDFVIQPLPVDHFYGELVDENSLKLYWQPVSDPLEPTAEPTMYKVYTRVNDRDFDSGFITTTPETIISEVKSGNIYSFKVTALNNGGESFPSEILSFGIAEGDTTPVMIVNGFDRISAPESFYDEEFAGFTGMLDNGVPYMYDIGFTGFQYDFEIKSEFLTNDAPGHGASFADYETSIIAGNTFDYTYIHGHALMENGKSFVSVSDEVFESGLVNVSKYQMIDLLYGEEKTTPAQRSEMADKLPDFKIFTPALITTLKKYMDGGGKVFLSGAYISTEIFENNEPDSSVVNFAKSYLNIVRGTDHASRRGIVQSYFNFPDGNFDFSFHTSLDDKFYAVESPDEISPGKLGYPLMRYKENSFCAAVGFRGDFSVITMGFPFEAIETSSMRTKVMKLILEYLK